MNTGFQAYRIGVLMGGPSTERTISLKSGKAVYECFKELNLDVVPVDIQTENVEENRRLVSSYNIDCAFIALHGRFGEDGGMQRLLDEMDIVYTGSGPAASKLAMDKVAAKNIFEKNGLHVPRSKVLNKGIYSGEQTGVSPTGGFPVVVKPARQGSSIGLSLVDNQEDLPRAIDEAFNFDDTVIVEECIAGREVTVGILGNNPLPVIEIIPKKRFFDFEAKYQKGLTDYVVPAQISGHVLKSCQDAALIAHSSLGCSGCSRVDFIVDRENRPFILEVNTIPGLTETSLLPKAAGAAGIDFSLLCLRLLGMALRKANLERVA